MKLLTKLSIALSALCFGLLLLGALELVYQHELIESVQPDPQKEETPDTEDYSDVDWEYWLAINPDIVAWINIPGTGIDYPVVHAPLSDPQYYLTHDVFGNWNYLGCIYLDAQCDDILANNLNTVLFGHNLGFGDTSMFATLTNYVNEAYAREHSEIIIQTPEKTYCYAVAGVRILQGDEQSKRIAFNGEKDFERWRSDQLKACQTSLSVSSPQDDVMLSLCTCSYFQQENERTIVYALSSSAS